MRINGVTVAYYAIDVNTETPANTAPVITLNGNAAESLIVGDSYNEPSSTAELSYYISFI